MFYMTNSGRMKTGRLRKATVAVFVLVLAVLAALHVVLDGGGSPSGQQAPHDFVIDGDPPF